MSEDRTIGGAAPDQAYTPGAAVPQPQPLGQPGEAEASLRGIRIWLTVLTVVVAVMILGFCGSVALFFAGVTAFSDYAMTQVTDEELDRVISDVEAAYGSRLGSLDVRTVEVEWGYAPTPFSWMEPGGEQAIYVEYRLQGSDVVLADVVGGMWGRDIASSGLIPTKGTLTSRMTEEQFDRALESWAGETDRPLGGVKRYTDRDPYMYDSGPSEKVFVAGEEYAARELWWMVEGRIVEGDRVNMDGSFDHGRKAFVFHEDPETGELAFLGTEPADMWW